MNTWSGSQLLMFGGIAVMAAAAAAAVLALILFRHFKKKLNKKMEQEFGAKSI